MGLKRKHLEETQSFDKDELAIQSVRGSDPQDFICLTRCLETHTQLFKGNFVNQRWHSEWILQKNKIQKLRFKSFSTHLTKSGSHCRFSPLDALKYLSGVRHLKVRGVLKRTSLFAFWRAVVYSRICLTQMAYKTIMLSQMIWMQQTFTWLLIQDMIWILSLNGEVVGNTNWGRAGLLVPH